MKSNLISKLSILLVIFSINNVFANANTFAIEEDDDNYSYNYNYGGARSAKCEVYDPYEKVNRKIFMFNSILDAFILRPVARGYDKLTNKYTKNRVESFVDNLREPLTTANYALQGNLENTHKSLWRFVINSTIGVGGLFDVASRFNLNAESQSFGNTLASYGVPQGPYIVLPIYGGMGTRDVTDPLFSDRLLNFVTWHTGRSFNNGVSIARLVHYRAKILPFTDHISENSVDPYISVRDTILQKREAQMVYPAGFKCPKVN